jgi:hypothetical protein
MRIPYYSLHWLPRRLSRSQILQSHTGSKTVVLRPLAVTIMSTEWPYTRLLASEPSSRKTMRSMLLVTTTKMMPTRMKRTLPSAKTRVRRLPKSKDHTLDASLGRLPSPLVSKGKPCESSLCPYHHVCENWSLHKVCLMFLLMFDIH